jgi:hypothetical protein
MSKRRRTFEAGFLDAALEAGLTEGALEAGLEVLDAGLAVLDDWEAGLATWDTGLEAGALVFDAGLAYQITSQMSQKRYFRNDKEEKSNLFLSRCFCVVHLAIGFLFLCLAFLPPRSFSLIFPNGLLVGFLYSRPWGLFGSGLSSWLLFDTRGTTRRWNVFRCCCLICCFAWHCGGRKMV